MSNTVTITLDRRFLEHPEAVHVRRMRAAIWLYLTLLGRLQDGSDTLEVAPPDVARSMGMREGTIRSWLGHLRRGGYAEVTRSNGGYRVRLRRVVTTPPNEKPAPVPDRFFTVEKLARSLGASADDAALAGALAQHPDDVIRRALAGALAVPAEEIRRSRTALFLYLLKHNAQED